MTVNCIYIERSGVAHATDSLITKRKIDSSVREVSEFSNKPKIVRIPHFKGVMSWFGTVHFERNKRIWNALEFLTAAAEKAEKFKPSKIQKFCDELAKQLGSELYDLKTTKPHLACGIHFTFFEPVKGVKEEVPELIFITNMNGIDPLGGYSVGGPEFSALRRTYHHLTGQRDDSYARHAETEYRKAVYDSYQNGGGLWITNGDIGMTGYSQSLTDSVIPLIMQRRRLRDADPLRLLGLKALYRAEIACLTQKVFYDPNEVLVGSPCYNLMVNSAGQYFSDTGI